MFIKNFIILLIFLIRNLIFCLKFNRNNTIINSTSISSFFDTLNKGIQSNNYIYKSKEICSSTIKSTTICNLHLAKRSCTCRINRNSNVIVLYPKPLKI